MPRPDEPTLRAWLLGGLEPGEATRLGEQVAASPSLQARVDALKVLLQDDDASVWSLPPPGQGHGLRLEAAPMQSYSVAQAGAAALLSLRFSTPAEGPRLVVLLHRGEAGWEVLLPDAEEDRLSLDELDRLDDGRVELLVRAAPGRWALALPPLDWPIDWRLDAAARWAPLQAALSQGEIPVAVIEDGTGP